MRTILGFLIGWPEKVAQYFLWAGPLVARFITGYVFVLSGWGKLHFLPKVTENFANWGIPAPQILAPFVSGMEFFGGLGLIFGFITRIFGGALAVIMVVAIISAKLDDIDSLGTLLGFDEMIYFAVFTWLAICGAGNFSLDHQISKHWLKKA